MGISKRKAFVEIYQTQAKCLVPGLILISGVGPVNWPWLTIDDVHDFKWGKVE